LGRAQARALGYPDLAIAVIPHPFGIRTRAEIRSIAEACVGDVARLLCEGPSSSSATPSIGADHARVRPLTLVAAPADIEEFNRFAYEHKWSDGLPAVPPTAERVAQMLRHTPLARDQVVARMAPALGEATVERIAVNAVLAGCRSEYLPVLIAAAEAVADPAFNLAATQATTNPAAVWLIVNGPVARRLEVNGGNNCLGPGAWANATLGRALRLMLQNIGGALPGEMDRATHGQPGKYIFCCAENEEASPWAPLHVERGFAPHRSAVTVVAALGTWNMNTHAKDSGDLLRVIADTMAFPCSSDYVCGGQPWVMLSPEHAQILHRDGLSKTDVKRRLWEQSKLAVNRLAAKDVGRVQDARRAELGTMTAATLVPISVTPQDICLLVAGGPGTHSMYIPVSGSSKSVTREVVFSG
jgi:hypothetical protein